MSIKIISLTTALGLIILTGAFYYMNSIKSYSPVTDLFIKDAYAFSTIQNAKTAAAFMTIESLDPNNHHLIGAQSDIAEFTETHQNYIDPDDGVMMMRRIKEIDIPSQSTTLLTPKGYHIMFINLKHQLKMGTTFPITLLFKNIETQSTKQYSVTVNVVSPGSNPHAHH